MTDSVACASAVIGQLLAQGVTDLVLAPGSRSAPLALVAYAAARDGRLRLHVRVDERSAGFLALGIAKASGRCVPIVTTSGTAVGNLLPAVMEAHHSASRCWWSRPTGPRRSSASAPTRPPSRASCSQASCGTERGSARWLPTSPGSRRRPVR